MKKPTPAPVAHVQVQGQTIPVAEVQTVTAVAPKGDKRRETVYEMILEVKGDNLYAAYSEDNVVFDVPIVLTITDGLTTESQRALSVGGRAVFPLKKNTLPVRATVTVEGNGFTKVMIIDPSLP